MRARHSGAPPLARPSASVTGRPPVNGGLGYSAARAVPLEQDGRFLVASDAILRAMPTNYRALHFGWKHRLVAGVSRRTNFTYTIRHGLAAGMRRRGGLGFVPWGPAETAETRFLRGLNVGGKVVYDIGAFEGLLTMFFSRRAGHVIAWEPNPESRCRLLTNLRLNRLANVLVRDVGLADAPGEATLVYDPLMPGAASGGGAVAGQIRDSAPALAEVGMKVATLDDEVRTQALPPPAFMKIDVEGMELPVLLGAQSIIRAHRPQIYIEMHGADPDDGRRNAREVVSLLWSLGYHDLVHVEAGEALTPETTDRPGHLFARG
jgi:FkbM family methyltransferase